MPQFIFGSVSQEINVLDESCLFLFGIIALFLFGTGVICGYLLCILQFSPQRSRLAQLKVQLQSSPSESRAQITSVDEHGNKASECVLQQQFQSSSSGEEPIQTQMPITERPHNEVVFTTLGKRFHTNKHCHGLDSRNTKYVLRGATRREAIRKGYTPCCLCGEV